MGDTLICKDFHQCMLAQKTYRLPRNIDLKKRKRFLKSEHNYNYFW